LRGHRWFQSVEQLSRCRPFSRTHKPNPNFQ
jgi:hypothetical protein